MEGPSTKGKPTRSGTVKKYNITSVMPPMIAYAAVQVCKRNYYVT